MTVNSPGVDPFSAMSAKLSLSCNGHVIASATGFVWKRRNRHYIISNWHVYSGRNCYTGQPEHRHGAIPDRIEAKIAIESKNHRYRWVTVSVDLLDHEKNVTWLQHPMLGQDIDIAALKLPLHDSEGQLVAISSELAAVDMKLFVGSDVYILGFPCGISKQGNLPIWKRGSVASEPDFPFDGLPLFVVDTATREGMSGSPVFFRANDYADEKGDRWQTFWPKTKFIGIYSGRYGGKDELGAQLGRVWHTHLIDEIVSGGTLGAYELRTASQSQQ